MTDTQGVARGLSDQELSQLLGLVEGADTVELTLTVPDDGHRSAVAALEMDPLEASLRQVFFFDTPDLLLNKHGVIARVRRIKGGDDDSVVKLRPVVPHELPVNLRKLPGFGVEVDAMPGGFVCSGRLKASVRPRKVMEVVAGQRPTRSLPVTVLKLKFVPRAYGRRLVAELWNYPDGSRILELSTKCAPSDAFEIAAKTRAFLEGRGVNVTGEQQTKTKMALEFFSR